MTIIDPPKAPTGVLKTITLKSGDSLDALAIKYHTTRASIMALNGLKDPDTVQIGQQLKINVVTDAEWKEYERLKSQYDDQVAREREQKTIAERTERSRALIYKAINEDGYGDDYRFEVNENGHIAIYLKKSKSLEDIREDFHLKKGRLLETNPSISKRYVQTNGIRRDGTQYKTYDGAVAKPGDRFVIDVSDFKTEKSFFQDVFDFFKNIVKN